MPENTKYYSGRLSDKKAQVFGERLQEIRDLEGGLTPEVVLEYARNKKDPLHRFFQWNDLRAAELYRRGQARILIRDISVERNGIRVRAFESVKVQLAETKNAGEPKLVRVYLPEDEVRSNKDLHEQNVIDVLRTLIHFKERYGHIKEIGPVVDAIEQLEIDLGLVDAETKAVAAG